MDESLHRGRHDTAAEAGQRRKMVFVLAVIALVALAAAWLLAAPAAGALSACAVLC